MARLNDLVTKTKIEFDNYLKYVGKVRLLRAIFCQKHSRSNSWEESLSEALDTLPERMRQVLAMRFGLADGQPKTLGEVGEAFGVTRERIRQLEARALRRLRHPSRRRVLLGDSWQAAAQEARQEGQRLFLERKPKEKQERKGKKLSEFDLPTRIVNTLLRNGYKTEQDIKRVVDDELLRCGNFGSVSLRLVREKIPREVVS